VIDATVLPSLLAGSSYVVKEYILPTPFVDFLYSQFPLGQLGQLERFDLSTFLKTVNCDLMLSFTIDSTRRPLPCVKNLPMGNFR